MPVGPTSLRVLAGGLLALAAAGCSVGRDLGATPTQPPAVASAPAPAPLGGGEPRGPHRRAPARPAAGASRAAVPAPAGPPAATAGATNPARPLTRRSRRPRRDVQPTPAPPRRPPAGRSPAVSGLIVGAGAAVGQARATVVRFHHLLDAHEPLACELLSPTFLAAAYGPDPASAIERCREAVRSIAVRIGVVVERAGASGDRAWVQVISRTGADRRRQTMLLVRLSGEWRIDAVTPGAHS